jgi:hypothetical protein
MAQGLYNHSTVPLSKEEEELQELQSGNWFDFCFIEILFLNHCLMKQNVSMQSLLDHNIFSTMRRYVSYFYFITIIMLIHMQMYKINHIVATDFFYVWNNWYPIQFYIFPLLHFARREFDIKYYFVYVSIDFASSHLKQWSSIFIDLLLNVREQESILELFIYSIAFHVNINKNLLFDFAVDLNIISPRL